MGCTHTHTHIERAKRQGHCRGSVRIDWYSRIAFYIAVRRLSGPLISFLTNDLSVKWQSFLNILSRIRRIMFTCLSSHAYPIRKTYQIEPLAYLKFRRVSLWSHFLPTHRCMLSRFPLPSNLTLNVIPRWRLWNLSLSKRHDLGSGSQNKKTCWQLQENWWMIWTKKSASGDLPWLQVMICKDMRRTCGIRSIYPVLSHGATAAVPLRMNTLMEPGRIPESSTLGCETIIMLPWKKQAGRNRSMACKELSWTVYTD